MLRFKRKFHYSCDHGWYWYIGKYCLLLALIQPSKTFNPLALDSVASKIIIWSGACCALFAICWSATCSWLMTSLVTIATIYLFVSCLLLSIFLQISTQDKGDETAHDISSMEFRYGCRLDKTCHSFLPAILYVKLSCEYKTLMIVRVIL